MSLLSGTPRVYGSSDISSPVYKVYHRRWFMLFLFSVLGVLNNLVCYTFAPVADQAYLLYGNDFPISMLITIFFITYVCVAFPASRFVEATGIRDGIVLGAWLQALGCCIRCLDLQGASMSRSSTVMIIVGQVVASLGQAFFVNPPPLLAATWFGEDERTMATTVACNADALGIAAAYLISPQIVSNPTDIPILLEIIAIVSVGFALITTFLFEDAPPKPPSFIAHVRRYEKEEHDHVVIGARHDVSRKKSIIRQTLTPKLSRDNSFNKDFDVKISDTLPYMDVSSPDKLEQNDISSRLNEEDKVQATPYITPNKTKSCVISASVTIEKVSSQQVDPNGSESDESDHESEYPILSEQSLFIDHKIVETMISMFKIKGFVHAVIVFAIAESTLNGFSTFMNSMLIPCGFSATYVSGMGSLFIVSAMMGSSILGWFVDRYKIYKQAILISFLGSISCLVAFNFLSSTSSPLDYFYFISATILGVGFFIGPLQPVALEVAAECVYPISENSSTAVQQVMGNLASASLVPLMMLLKDTRDDNMINSNWFLTALVSSACLFFATFNGVYLRSEAEDKHKSLLHK